MKVRLLSRDYGHHWCSKTQVAMNAMTNNYTLLTFILIVGSCIFNS